MNNLPPSQQTKVSLLVADVDGILVTKQKVLTRVRLAVQKLHDAGIAFSWWRNARLTHNGS